MTPADAPPRILIADDQADVVEALRLLLKGEGFGIVTASSPAGVLRAVHDESLDVVLMDLNYTRDTTSGREGLDLLARLRALLRRSVEVAEDQPLIFGPIRLDPSSWQVTVDGEPLILTRTEFALLETFLRHPRQVLGRSQIFDAVWGPDLDESSNSLHVYIGYLRRKLEAVMGDRVIHTVRGVGYMMQSHRAA